MADKPLLVLVHGWGVNAYVWGGIRDQLGEKYEVRTPELPGHGACLWHEGDAERLVDRLRGEVGRPAFWLGWSLGALLVMQLALQAPQLVQGLMLVSATPKFMQSCGWESAMPVDVFDNFYTDFERDPERTLQRFLALQSQGDQYAQSVLRHLKSMSGQHAQWEHQTAVWGLDMLHDTDLRQQLAGIKQPVHLLHGANDRVISMQAGHYLAEKVGGKMTTWEQTGHAPFLSRPEEFVHWVEQATS